MAEQGRDLLARSAGQFTFQLFLAQRITTRVFEATLALSLHRPWLAAVAGAFVLADLRLSSLTRAPVRGGLLLPRLGLDTADMTLWALALHGSSATTAIVLAPLAAQAGMRLGVASFAVPAVGSSVTMIILTVTRTPTTWLVYLWPMAAVVMGFVGGAYLRARHRVHERNFAWEIEAAAVRAEVAGRDSVAARADALIDVLARADPLIRAFEPDPPAFPLQATADGRERNGVHAVYLQEAVMGWQHAHNGASPALADDVEVRLGSKAGTLLLSAPQQHHLMSAITAMDLRGEVMVDAKNPGPVGTAQVITVNRWHVRLPADPVPLPQALHPVPLAFLWGVIIVLLQSLPGWEAVPLVATGPLAAACLGAAWWAHRRLTSGGRVAPGAVLTAAVVLGASQAIVTSALARPGSGRLPFLFFLLWVGLLLGFYLRDLPVARQALALGGCLLASTAGALVAPDRVAIMSLPIALLWPLAGALSVSGLRGALDSDVALLRGSFERRRCEAVRTAYRRAIDQVIKITSSAVTEMSSRFAAAPLPAPERAEVGRRLAEAFDFLDDLVRTADAGD